MMAKALVPIWLLSWVVLLPINAIGQNTGAKGLDMFTSGNIDEYHTKRYWAHLILDYIFVCMCSILAAAGQVAVMCQGRYAQCNS
jgi:hypothetical protein